jgi:hypothetical protein
MPVAFSSVMVNTYPFRYVRFTIQGASLAGRRARRC